MVRVCGLVAGLLITAAVGAAEPMPGAPATPAPLPEARIGFPAALFKDVPQGLIQVAAKPFERMIQQKAGLKGSMEVVPDYKQLAERLRDGKLEIAVFHGFEYAWVKDTPGLVPLVVTVPNCGKVQACLVVNKGCKANGPGNLTGACVAVPKGSKAHCQMYLDWLRDNENVPANCCCPAKPDGSAPLTPEDVLGEVAAGRSEAALVDISSLKAFEKQFPGAFTQLKVLRESKSLPPAVVVYRKDALTKDQVTAVRNGLVNSVNTAEGRAFAMFWNLKGFKDVSPDYLETVDECLKAYPPPVNPPTAVATPK